jgi:hypothetical protein
MPICGNLNPVRNILCDSPKSIRAVSEACDVKVGNPQKHSGQKLTGPLHVASLEAIV